MSTTQSNLKLDTEIRNALLGLSEIKPIEHMIDCDADPMIPDGWSIEKHIKGGKFRWIKDQVLLFLSRKQMSGKVIGGHDLRQELADKPVLNACVLDYLLKNPHLIPEEWKGKVVSFWGTVYRNGGVLCVRYLYWNRNRWYWGYDYLDNGWIEYKPAAVCVG